MKVLLLCNYDIFGAAMVTEHINAIVNHSQFDVYVYSKLVRDGGEIKLGFDLDEFDFIIVHYSIFLAVNAYCSTRTKAALKAARGIKVAFLQDEYRFVNRSIEAMHEAGINLVFSCVPQSSIDRVYPPERMKGISVRNTLTGYVSEYLTTLQPRELKRRRYDVSYRGRRYPDWHGAMGREKYSIAEEFLKRSRWTSVKTNISCHERDRLYGARWVDLIQNSRAVLGVESGASVFDFSGEISTRTETLRYLFGRKGISYNELRDRCFADVEGRIDLSQISPRVLEAISLRSLCVLFEGSYSGLLKPDIHYLPLRKDFSNYKEVIEKLKDDRYVSDIITNAYSDIAMNPDLSYGKFVRTFDAELLECHHTKVGMATQVAPFDNAPLENSRGLTGVKSFSKRQKRFLKARQFREAFDTAHPFTIFRYPHSLVVGIPKGGIVHRAAHRLKSAMPFPLRQAIKSIVR
jgi:hypothetical protein